MSQTEVQLIKADAVQTGDIANSAVTDAKISGVASSKLTGALPAISGAALTNLPASGKAKNLIINGAMKIAQRGTSSTSTGYQTCDRIQAARGGGAITQAQVDISSSDTPYSLGFRKAFKVTNSTAASAAGNYRDIRYYVEAQDVANSGWNSVSSSSNITLSFWARSSVAQTYYYFIYVPDSSKHFVVSFALSANTWTKVTKTIPGATGVTINNDNGNGLNIQIAMWYGSDFTTSGQAVDTWGSWSGSSRVPDMTSTWAATTDATFEITGVQLEVGDSATDFEHKTFAEELQLCRRYYEDLTPKLYILARYSHHNVAPYGQYHFNVQKRVAPTCSSSGSFESSTGYSGNPSFTDTTVDATTIYGANSVTAGGILYLHTSGSGNGLLKFDAEL